MAAASLSGSSFDVVVVGTGLIESVIAGACARAGRSVLHIDRVGAYGGQWMTLSLEDIHSFALTGGERSEADPEKEKPGIASLLRNVELGDMDEELFSVALADGRSFNIDLCQKMVLAHCDFLDALVDSGVCRYLDFKDIQTSLMLLDDKIVKVPASRGDVFASSVVSLKQKRQLMKFLKSCNDFNESGDLAVVGIEDENESFSSFLERSGLDSTLLRLILYPIALLFDDPNASSAYCTVFEGFQRVGKFLSSAGRFCDSPFLYPLFGIGELPQAFCRLGAVYGGIYALGRSLSEFRLSESPEASHNVEILDSEGDVYSCSYLVAGCEYFPEYSRTVRSLVRCICILNQSLMTNEDFMDAPNSSGSQKSPLLNYILTIPPHAIGNSSTVFVMQYDASVLASPQSFYALHLVTALPFVPESSFSARAELQPVIDFLFSRAAECWGTFSHPLNDEKVSDSPLISSNTPLDESMNDLREDVDAEKEERRLRAEDETAMRAEVSVSHSGVCMNNKDCEVNSSCYPPVVVWSSYFVQDIFEPIENLPVELENKMFIIPTASDSIDCDDIISSARRVFRDICPDAVRCDFAER